MLLMQLKALLHGKLMESDFDFLNSFTAPVTKSSSYISSLSFSITSQNPCTQFSKSTFKVYSDMKGKYVGTKRWISILSINET